MLLFYRIQISLLTKFNMLLTSFPFLCNIDKNRGEMSEWFKETVLKTVDAQASRGSNPRFSEMERCESGRIGLPAKELYPSRVPGVRIPPFPFVFMYL